jgi:hypothetical protein
MEGGWGEWAHVGEIVTRSRSTIRGNSWPSNLEAAREAARIDARIATFLPPVGICYCDRNGQIA